VIRGKRRGPVLFISAAIHGDEINGTEIVRRLSIKKSVKNLRGTLILIPIVNIFGFNHKSRYLPDRKDLNRSFPGSPNGSLAARVANLFMKEVVSKCSHGIDLHTGAIHRYNLPQIRAAFDDKATEKLGASFGAPVMINSKLRDGSLREAARKKNVKMLLFEGGQALRFEENIIRLGVKGCLSVMREIGMLTHKNAPKEERQVFHAQSSSWVRAPKSGTFVSKISVGDYVSEGDVLAVISDPFGTEECEVYCHVEGIVIGTSQLPLVNQGDAMFHVGSLNKIKGRFGPKDEALNP
jgi:predicted deacylase